MKRAFLTLAFLAASQFGAALAADCTASITTIDPGKLTVAAYDYPPFTMVADGKITGVDPSIVKRFAKENCLEVVPLVMDPAGTVQAVVSGKADIAIGSWYRTAKRAKIVDQSAPTYVDSMGIYSKDGVDSIKAMEGKNVGTVQGFFWVPDLQKVFGANLKLYPTPLAMAQDLGVGRLDVAITGYNAGNYIQKHSGGYKGIQIKRVKADDRVSSTLQPSQTGFLITKGNSRLEAALSKSINAQHADGSILKALKEVGFDDATAEVGEPRLVK